MATILLVNPLFLAESPAEQASASTYFPLGLLSLAAYVRERGHEVAIFDGTFEPDEASFATALAATGPDLVGISTLMPTRDTAVELARTAADSGTVVVVGGPDATTHPDLYLREPAVHILVHHEGEQTIVRLLDLWDRGSLTTDALRAEPGIAFSDQGRPVVNQPRPPIEDLDELPLPARDLVDIDHYLQWWRETNGYSSLTIATSRGCPHGCGWCRDSVHGTGFRQRSPESVAAEVKAMKTTFDVDRLRLVDDVDAIERAWLDSWAVAAEAIDAVIPFEALNDLSRRDIPMLDVRDSL